MQSSYVYLSLALCVLAAPAWALAQAAEEVQPGGQAGAEVEGPPAPEETIVTRGQVLVLPSITSVDASVDGASLDMLLSALLQDLGFEVKDSRALSEQLDEGAPTLDQAREHYLNLNLEEALESAAAVREAHLAHRGDLLADARLAEAELFMVQVQIELGQQFEAAQLAAQILVRQPALRLDPAEHTSSMLALWSATVLGQTGRSPPEPPPNDLAAFGREVGVDWVVMGILYTSNGNGGHLVVLVVPTTGDEESSRHEVILGPRPQWASSVRSVLLERFPPPAPPKIPSGQNGGETKDNGKWYKSWWFWTIVGSVVVGGTAASLGAYYSSREEERPQVTGNFW